ncbi:MAG: tetratricopeptide repeat protein [Acidobacteriota bacterium]
MLRGAAKQIYSRKEVRRLLGIGETQLRSWEKQDLVPSLQSFTFPDLLALRTLQKLRRSRVSAARIRSILAALRQKVNDIRDPLKELKIVPEGRRVTVVIEGHKMEPLSGQLLLDFDREEFARLIAFPTGGPAGGPAAQAREAELWFQRGLELEQTGAPFDEVVEAYERAVALDPHSAGAMVNLGTVHYHRRNWVQAERWYMKALEVDPTYALAHFNLGNLFDEKGDRPGAVTHYERAIRLNPRYADAHYNLALLCQCAGATMQAVHHWQVYLRLDPNSSWAAIARRELEKLRQATVLPGSRPGGPA